MSIELMEIAQAHILQTKLHTNVLQDFKEGVVNYSQEPMGILYWATNEQKAIIEKIEERGDCKVWHIIKGLYVWPDGDRQQVETYLLAIKEVETLQPWNDGLLAYSYSRFPQVRSHDYGDVVIAPRNGGLKRIT